MSSHYDAIVIGAGPGGEVCAGELADAGMRVGICERELVAGECSYWACMPTKALLAPGEALARARATAGARGAVTGALDVADVMAFRDAVVANWDDTGQVGWLDAKGIDLLRGNGRIAGPGIVEVDGMGYATERIVVATGSYPLIPPIPGLADLDGVWTNREAASMRDVPDSIIILGGGAVGVEMAQVLSRFGSEVTIVEGSDHLLARETPMLGQLLAEQFTGEGIEVVTGRHATACRFDRSRFQVTLDDGTVRDATRLLIATGRRPRVDGIGLETVGIEPNPRGIQVDERMRAADRVWAIGDCTGLLMFTHVGKYQGRIAAADMLGRSARADYRAVPRVVFTDPQVAAVGATDGPVVATVGLAEVARTYAAQATPPSGFLTLVSDGVALIGASAAGPDAGEWLQQATLAIRASVPLNVLLDTIQPFPTYSEIYLKAMQALVAAADDCSTAAQTAVAVPSAKGRVASATTVN